MTSLTDVILLENRLTGAFPDLLLRDNKNLAQIQLGGNRLSGRIPTFLSSAALTDLRAEGNSFTGSIPAEFAVGFDSLCKFGIEVCVLICPVTFFCVKSDATYFQ